MVGGEVLIPSTANQDDDIGNFFADDELDEVVVVVVAFSDDDDNNNTATLFYTKGSITVCMNTALCIIYHLIRG